MKRAGLAILLFVVVFFGVYLACCYLVPGWRIKLAADPLTYLIESVGHMAPLKSLISLGAGLMGGYFPCSSLKGDGAEGALAPANGGHDNVEQVPQRRRLVQW